MHHALAALYNPALPKSLGGGPDPDYTQGTTIIGKLITNIIGFALIVAFLFALAYLLTGGIQWLTSGGDKAQLEGARNKITNAIIGLVIVAATYAVFTLIGQFFGITLPSIKIPTFTG